MPQSFFNSSQNAEKCASKETTRLRTSSEDPKVYINLLGGPILSDIEFLVLKSRTVIPHTRFFGSVQKRRRKGQCTSKKTTKLRTGSKASKVHIQLLGGPILSDIEFLAHKSRTVIPRTRFFGSVSKHRGKAQWPRKGRSDLERGPRPRKSTSSYWVVRF